MSERADATALKGIHVLVVDDEVNLRFAIERGLRKAGHIADSASTVRQAIERLRSQAYDIVITDLRMPGGDGVELVNYVGSYSPSTRVVVVSAFVTDEFRAKYEQSVRVVEKPVELPTLIGIIDEIGPRRGFFGNSIEVELFDYVQMIALSGRDKQISVATPGGDGMIWFEHGDVVHCTYAGTHQGEQAFYKLLSVGRGSFHEVIFRDPDQRTIMGSSTHLLMEAARMMDEGTLGQEPEAKPTPVDDETSFADLSEDTPVDATPGDSVARGTRLEVDDDLLVTDDDEEEALAAESSASAVPQAVPFSHTPVPATESASALGLFDDPETRDLMLGQFFEYEGVNGVAIISSTGKVLAEDMRANAALVTLAGFYMRGAARIARALGHNVFDGVAARSETGQQLLMVGMGATSAVLSVEIGCDPEEIRQEIMGELQ